MQIEFKTRNNKQLEAARYWIDTTTEKILYGGAKGGGKSFLGASLIFGDALIYPDTHYFIARKELNDLRKFTIPTIHKVFQNFKLDIDKYAKYNGQNDIFKLHNGSMVYLIACKEEPSDPMFERFGSMEMTRGWAEEAGEIAEDAISNLWLSIGRWRNTEYNLKKKLLITANPKKGWMKRDFVDPFKSGVLPRSRQYIQAFATDNPYLPDDYVDSLRNERDKVRKQRLFEGNWDYDEDADALTTYDALSDAFTNTITKSGQKYMTVDVARLGSDSTVIAFWDGLELYKIQQYRGQSTDTTEQIIRDFAASEHIPFSHIIIDEDGIGGGVVDHLKGVKGFTANSTPIPTRSQVIERTQKLDHYLVPKTTFANLRAQCGWKLAEIFNQHEIAIRTDEYRGDIIEDLTAELRAKDVASDGRKQLRPKADVKEEIGRSPDIGDTLIMRMFFELLSDSTGESDSVRFAALQEQSVIFSRNKRNLSVNSAR